MSTIGYINVSLETFGGLLSLIFILNLKIIRRDREPVERHFHNLLICNTALLFSDAAAWLFKGRMDLFSIVMVHVANFLVFSLGFIILALFTRYLVSFLTEKGALLSKMPQYIIGTLMGCAVGLVILSQFNDMFYMIDEHNVYHRQSWFWLSQVFGLAWMLFNGGLLVRYRKKMSRKEAFTFAIYIILPAAALLLQMLFYGIAVLYLATTICLLAIHISIQTELSHEISRKELELVQSRTAIMMSQIQPHFLYNSLLGIKQLCDTEPVKASEALEHFSYFLRGNLYSISDPKLIPFEKELTHVRDYLYLEVMRFEERITARWEISFTDFLLPSLTLQPIVENAIRHGITKKEEGGTLTIKNEKTADSVLITITDDGAGFDTAAPLDESRPHIGLENVRRRLEIQCGGSLSIRSVPGKGTTVIISLPLCYPFSTGSGTN